MKMKLARISKELTQKELAELVGISNVTIVKIERGNFNNVKFGILKKIARALDTTVLELFYSDDEK